MAKEKKKNNWNKPISSNSKSPERLKKIYSFILVLAIVVIFAMKYLDGVEVNSKNIYSLIGNGVSSSISVKNSLFIRGYSIVPFANYLSEGNYKMAYEMCTSGYKEIFSQDEFYNMFKDIDPESIDMKEVKARSDLCYEAKVVYRMRSKEDVSGESARPLLEQVFLLFPNELNTEIIRISPNGFLYGYEDLEFSKNGIDLNLEKCYVYADHVYVKGSIKNSKLLSKIELADITLEYGTSLVRRFPFYKILEKGDTVDFEHTIKDTEYFMPDNIKVDKYKNKNATESIEFYFKEGKIIKK